MTSATGNRVILPIFTHVYIKPLYELNILNNGEKIIREDDNGDDEKLRQLGNPSIEVTETNFISTIGGSLPETRPQIVHNIYINNTSRLWPISSIIEFGSLAASEDNFNMNMIGNYSLNTARDSNLSSNSYELLNTTDNLNSSNITLNDSSQFYDLLLSWQGICLITVFCVFIVITIIGNTLVILAVITTRRLKTVTNCFVMSLAVADLLVGIFVMPAAVAVHLTGGL